eukprot:TRINITY_DN1093_c2_g1_i1.p1 TRINITY_DN1093_c2_g1~~TRINITY_DN1093_c2_g1_i1.p1  ORF type:complete len:315 (-),score=71.33 TRINITY_DN1093_c2_g1_i1:117-1061(-)
MIECGQLIETEEKNKKKTKKSTKNLTFRELQQLDVMDQGQSFNLDLLIPLINKFSKGNKGYFHQEDAEEFLCWLLNNLHEECIKVDDYLKQFTPIGGFNNNNDVSGWKEVSKKGKSSTLHFTEYQGSIISDIFGCKIRSILSKKGSTTSVSIDPYFCLSLDIDDKSIKSVETALQHFFSKQNLSGVKNKNKLEIKSSIQLSIQTLPIILVLQLKRFTYNKGSNKITKDIYYDTELIISPSFFMNKKLIPPVNKRKYQLFSIVTHHGYNLKQGHYTTDILSNSQWTHFNDNKFNNINKNTALNREGYLLFYRKVD